MPRVKRGTSAHKRRQKVLKQTKGFRWGRKSKYRLAQDALTHAQVYAYRDRKVKKRLFRRSWESKINSACRKQGITYSKFIAGLKKNNIELDRKVLAELIEKDPTTFAQIIEKAKA